MYKSTLFLATFVLSLFGEMAYAGVPSSGDAAAWIKRREAKPVDFSPNVTVRHTRSLEKRFHAERLTYFYPGLGACGHRHGDGDAVIALNAPQWNGGQHCGKSITIRANGKTAEGVVWDLLPEGAYGALDVSPSLFQVFYPLGQGVFEAEWSFGGGGGGGSDEVQHTTTHRAAATPTTTTSRWVASTSSTTTRSATSTTTTTTSEAPIASGDLGEVPTGNIALLFDTFMQQAGLSATSRSLRNL